jgi:L-ascorbate metabolism protein UlaG (beta-lactamase superfamily)
MHWGTFPAIEADPHAFARAAGTQARVVVLQPGEAFDF